MADFSGIYTPPPGTANGTAGGVQTASLNAATSTAEIVFSKASRLAIAVTGNANVRFGNSGMTAASASDVPLWGSSTSLFNLGTSAGDRIRIFNPGASAITYYVFPIYT